jgi:hypothetical protein
MPDTIIDEIKINVDIIQYEALIAHIHQLDVFELKIVGDGNCGPRAIASRVYGHEDEHQKVREEICDFMLKEYAIKLSKLI